MGAERETEMRDPRRTAREKPTRLSYADAERWRLVVEELSSFFTLRHCTPTRNRVKTKNHSLRRRLETGSLNQWKYPAIPPVNRRERSTYRW
jgi:hypothetical protein